MEAFGKYILSITAVCICCSLVRVLVGGKSGAAGIIPPLCGVILAITVISPVIRIRAGDIRSFTSGIHMDADMFVQEGIDISNQELRTIITERTAAYILEKASFYDSNIDQIEVELTTDSVPVPCGLKISGTFSPNNRNRMSGDIEANLGIPKEKQQWIYQN